MLHRPDNSRFQLGHLRRAARSAVRPGLLLVLVLALVAPGAAQVGKAQRAIEKLEGCSKQERSKGCVNILLSRPAGDNLQAIKAQIRGGRIIWYEFNTSSGKVRRTN